MATEIEVSIITDGDISMDMDKDASSSGRQGQYGATYILCHSAMATWFDVRLSDLVLSTC